MITSAGKIRLITITFLILGSPLLVLSGCTPGVVGAPEELPPFSENCQMCARWMEGSFSNELQANKDGRASFHWLHQVRIWPERTDGIWLYSELNQTGQEGTPLQQVVYRINDNLSGGIIMESYRLPGSLNRYLGDWRAPREFNSVDRMTLDPMPSCNINLTRNAKGALAGSSRGQGCPSMLPGSNYQRTKLRIGSLGLTLWLTGFNQAGAVVFSPGSEGMDMIKQDSTKAPVSIKPGTDVIPDIGTYELKTDEED